MKTLVTLEAFRTIVSHLHNQCGKAAAGVVVQVVEEEPWVWAASAVPKAGSSGLVMVACH